MIEDLRLAGSATLTAVQKAVNNLKKPTTTSNGLSENGFKLLASYEATSAVKDKKGNVVSIPILDVGDGMYTIGVGNTVKKTDTKTIKEYKEKYGVDVTKVGSSSNLVGNRYSYHRFRGGIIVVKQRYVKGALLHFVETLDIPLLHNYWVPKESMNRVVMPLS